MELDAQTLFNLLIAVAGAFVTYFLSRLSADLNAIRAKDEQHDKRIGAIELLIARQYMTREEFTTKMDKFDEKMDKHFERMFKYLNEKADKEH